MVAFEFGFLGFAQVAVGADHFAHSIASAQFFAQSAKGAVRDACHGGKEEVVFEGNGGDVHKIV